MTKNYTQAPLPFQGQKRKWNGEFKQALRHFDDCNVFVDLFGGSGLLSHFTHTQRPDAVVIYNDFDGYHSRIANIPRTNALLADLRTMLQGYPDSKMIREPLRTAILERILEDERTGMVDYITLSSSLLFSMNYATSYEDLRKNTLYNNIRQTDYNADGYLDGIEVVRHDYRDLFNRWRGRPNVCFFIDPPYLSTDAATYTNYWRLGDYLDVLHTLKDTNYFYFTSNKSSIVELCDWLEHNYDACNPFAGAVRRETTSRMNYNSTYTDIMLFKHR